MSNVSCSRGAHAFLVALTAGVVSAVTLTVGVTAATAQSAGTPPATTTVRGVVYDSLRSQPLAGALVELAGSNRSVIADRRGAFRLDSVPLGAQRFSFSAPALDSIGLYGFAVDVDVRTNTPALALTTPSFRTFYTRMCAPTERPPADSAIVFGTIYDAMTRARMVRSQVAFQWFAVDTSGGGMRISEPTRTARTDDQGNYGVCGLPHDLSLTTLAGDTQTASGSVSLSIGNARVLRRDLYVSGELGGDSASLRVGSGELRGVVRDERGGAMVGALLVLTASGHTTRTDSLGRWVFRRVPLGTQEISVRQLGRGALFRTVDIVAGEVPDEVLVLPEATVLAAVNVRGVSIPGRDQAEFLARRRQGFGYALGEKEIGLRPDMMSALSRLPALDVRRTGAGMVMRNSRYQWCGSPEIVIDGVPSGVWGGGATIPGSAGAAGAQPVANVRLESIIMRDVVAIEWFPNGDTAPVKFTFGAAPRCGMLLVWTRFARW